MMKVDIKTFTKHLTHLAQYRLTPLLIGLPGVLDGFVI
jgi:hypothetical protein